MARKHHLNSRPSKHSKQGPGTKVAQVTIRKGSGKVWTDAQVCSIPGKSLKAREDTGVFCPNSLGLTS